MHKNLFCLLMVGLISITSCSRNKADIANTLLVDINAEPTSLDPQKAEDAKEFRVTNDLFAGLVDYDQTNKPAPGMASSWDISDDGKTYTFHLRPNLKFSDGTPITANDFVYTYERLVDPKTASAYNFLLAGVVNANAIIKGTKPASSLGVSASDPQTFIVNLERPMSEFLTYITANGVSVVPQKTIEKFGSAWTDPKNIVTSGAYTLKEHVVNGYIEAEKNINYYDANNVHINRVKYFPYTDTNVSLSNYETDNLDTTWKNIPIDRFASIKDKYKNELHVTPSERSVHLSFNLKLPKYADNLKLRKALSMAIDRDILSKEVLKSGQQPLYSIVTPTIENGKYADTKYEWASWSRDKQIKEAKKLFAEAGYGPNHLLNVSILTYTNDQNKKICLAIAAMWKSVLGVDTTLDIKEVKSWVSSGRKGEFDIRLSGWGADYNSVTTYIPLYQCGNGNNFSNYCSKEYETKIIAAQNIIDTKAQTNAYKSAINTVLNDYPVVPLIEPTQQRLVKHRVHGYQIGDNYLDNVQSKWMTLSN